MNAVMSQELLSDRMATYRGAAALIIIHIVALIVGFGVLGAVFEFPEVLRLSAADRLALYRANQGIIQPTYWVLAMTGFTQAAMAVLLCRSFARTSSSLLQVALAFGVLCGLLQMAGFIRWAILIPYLAEQMVNADTHTAATLAIIEGVFNRYAGMALGEHAANICLGVWTFGVGFAMRRSKLFDRRLAGGGMALGVTAAVLALEQLGIWPNLLGIVLDFLFPLWAVWLLVVAVSLLKTNPETGEGTRAGLAYSVGRGDRLCAACCAFRIVIATENAMKNPMSLVVALGLLVASSTDGEE